MFRSTTIIRELQCPCQSHYYLTTVVCMLSFVVWQNIILFGSVDDQSSTALARTRTPGTLLKHKPIQTI